MRCASYCTCDLYNLKDLSDGVSSNMLSNITSCSSYNLYAGNTVLHICCTLNDDDNDDDKKQKSQKSQPPCHIFVFNYGCVVFWGGNEAFESAVIKSIAIHGKNSFVEPIVDVDLYQVCSKDDSHIDVENDIIHVHVEDTFILLAFAYGLSQSVKLITFENAIEKTIETNKELPFELMSTGKTSLSRRSLAKKIGSLFAKRHLITLNSNILDIPEFFWKRPKYEVYYKMVMDHLELRQRIGLLNDRLNIIHELYTILSDELKQSNSLRLEWIVILLIFFEVLLSVLRDVLKVF